MREDASLSADERNRGVTELIELVGAVDGILQAQSAADARYFNAVCSRKLSAHERESVEALVLKAYRWQYIVSGLQQSRFGAVLTTMITPAQHERIGKALEPIMRSFTAH